MSDESDLEKQPSIPGYTITKRLGEGVFGTVYEAVQDRLGRIVALKIAKAVPGGDDSLKEEIAKLSRLRHPNIVAIYDADTAPHVGGAVLPYIAMELLEEGCLKDRFPKARVQQPLRENLRCYVDLLRAVQYAHAQGITHSDLHEQNLIVTSLNDRPHVKVADFGFPSHYKPLEASARITQDEKHLRALFWKFFYFPQVDSYIEVAEFNRLNLAGMIAFLEGIISFRLYDTLLAHDEQYIGVTDTTERERRLSTLAMAYVLDHSMKRNIQIKIQPWLGADIAVERGEDVDTFLLWPGVSTQAAAYMFLLLSISDVHHHDYSLNPSETIPLAAPDPVKDLCRHFIATYRMLLFMSDLERRGYLQPTILTAMHDALARCMGASSLADALVTAGIFNSILRKYRQQEIELDESRTTDRQRETVVGFAYTVSRLPWNQLLSLEGIRRLLQVLLDHLCDHSYATHISPDNGLRVLSVERIEEPRLEVDIKLIPDGESRVRSSKYKRTARLELEIREGVLGQVWALAVVERSLRLPASQFFESPDVSILARQGIGLYYLIENACFTFGGKDADELYEQFDSAVQSAARRLSVEARERARLVALNAIQAQRQFYDRFTVISRGSFEDRDYQDKFHPLVASYGMVEHVERGKTQALKQLDDVWFERAAESAIEIING